MKKTVFNTKTIATMAILTALSYILYVLVKFPIPFLFPSFLDIQFSDLPIILGSYMFGIPAGLIMTIARFLLKMPLTSTAMVGETADLMITIAYIIPSSILFRKSASKHKLVLSLVVGAISATLMAMVANQFILIPFYVEFFFGGQFEILLLMVRPLYPNVTESTFFTYYQFLAVLPFNILRLSICSVLVKIIYEKLKAII
ncbi:MAG: ECF transporter S component [Bacillota bacterium]